MALPEPALLSPGRRKEDHSLRCPFVFIVYHSELDTMPSQRKKARARNQAERERERERACADHGKPAPVIT